MAQPTQECQQAIESLHAAIASEPDPEDKLELTKALQITMKVQAKNMAQDQAEGGGQQAPPEQGLPPELAGPPPEADPRAALMAQLGGGGF